MQVELPLTFLLQGGAVLRAARRMYDRSGFDPETGMHMAEQPPMELVEPINALEDGMSKRPI